MKRWLWIGSLALGASLLVACNQSGGGNEGVGSTQRVIVRQLDAQSATVLYRLENASRWLPLNLTGGVASFAAQGGYEVVARCPQSVLFFKQTVQRRDQIVFILSRPPVQEQYDHLTSPMPAARLRQSLFATQAYLLVR
jgi:hypothetical protein